MHTQSQTVAQCHTALSLSREIARAPVYTFTYLSIYLNFVCLWRIYLFNILCVFFNNCVLVFTRGRRDTRGSGHCRVGAVARHAGGSVSRLPGQSCFVYK